VPKNPRQTPWVKAFPHGTGFPLWAQFGPGEGMPKSEWQTAVRLLVSVLGLILT
jgi:hypothetical protein